MVLGLPILAATATSLVVIVVNAAAGFSPHVGDSTLNVAITVAFTGAAILGAVAAGRQAPRLRGSKVRRWFAYLVLAVAAYLTIPAVKPSSTEQSSAPRRPESTMPTGREQHVEPDPCAIDGVVKLNQRRPSTTSTKDPSRATTSTEEATTTATVRPVLVQRPASISALTPRYRIVP